MPINRKFKVNQIDYHVSDIEVTKDRVSLFLEGREYCFSLLSGLNTEQGGCWHLYDERSKVVYRGTLVGGKSWDDCREVLISGGEMYHVLANDYDSVRASGDVVVSQVNPTAPINGIVRTVLVAEGTHVKVDQVVMIIEAMKMHISVVSRIDGIVRSVCYQPSELVREGDVLIVLEPV
jgi:acetyl/propionyl-CoA carboxylase alpha subunit